MSKSCKKCGVDVKDAHKFCPNCGNEFKETMEDFAKRFQMLGRGLRKSFIANPEERYFVHDFNPSIIEEMKFFRDPFPGWIVEMNAMYESGKVERSFCKKLPRLSGPLFGIDCADTFEKDRTSFEFRIPRKQFMFEGIDKFLNNFNSPKQSTNMDKLQKANDLKQQLNKLRKHKEKVLSAQEHSKACPSESKLGINIHGTFAELFKPEFAPVQLGSFVDSYICNLVAKINELQKEFDAIFK